MRKKLLVLTFILLAILLGVIVGLPYYRDSQLPRATAVWKSIHCQTLAASKPDPDHQELITLKKS